MHKDVGYGCDAYEEEKKTKHGLSQCQCIREGQSHNLQGLNPLAASLKRDTSYHCVDLLMSLLSSPKTSGEIQEDN